MNRTSVLEFLRAAQASLSFRHATEMPIRFKGDCLQLDTRKGVLGFSKAQVAQIVVMPGVLHFAIADEHTPLIELTYSAQITDEVYSILRKEISSHKIRWRTTEEEALAKATSGAS